MRILHKIKEIFFRQKNNWSSFREKNYSNTESSKIWLFNLYSSIMIGSLFIDSGLPKIISFILFTGLAYLFINLIRIILILVLKPIFHKGVKSASYTILLLLTIFIPMYAGSYVVSMPLILLISIGITAMEILFAKSIWSFFCCKRRSVPVIVTLSITVILNIMIGVLLFGEGYKDNYRNSYLSLSNQSRNNLSEMKQNLLELGKLPVSHTEYGIKRDDGLPRKTTDLTPYIDNYQGISSKLRGLYWKYDIDKVPLAGKIWYPTQGENFPVLFIIHGNHIMTTKSYLGYDYLGEYLASYGYVVISVDEAFCNTYINFGLSNENDARAILLLENMRLIESYNNDKKSRLYQKMNFSNIALAGHSRGGESVATAALFNHYDCYPDDGNIKWDYNFNIKSLIAIAPTYDQYQPAQHAVQVNDLNYLLIQGSNDHDVSSFMGYSQYHNITFHKDSDLLKACVYVAGANHGQFNTKWGRYDLPYPIKPFLNTNNLLSASEQRNILKAYTKVFLDITLKNDKTNKSFITDNQSDRSGLPSTIYIQSYQDSSLELLCDFDEDSNTKYGIADTVLLDAKNMSKWKEVKNPITKAANDYVLSLEWKDTKEADYSITLPRYNALDGYLQFDIMDIKKESLQSNNLDAVVSLTDSHGNISSLHSKDYITLYPPLPVMLFKLQFLTNTKDYKLCFQTVRLSCKEFQKMNNDFDSTSIVKIDFKFDKNKNGKVMLDNIGFGK